MHGKINQIPQYKRAIYFTGKIWKGSGPRISETFYDRIQRTGNPLTMANLYQQRFPSGKKYLILLKVRSYGNLSDEEFFFFATRFLLKHVKLS